MDATTYAKRYHEKIKDVEKWLREERIRGAVRTKNGTWDIPEDAKVEYFVRKKHGRKTDDDAFDILRALRTRRYIDAELLGCSHIDFRDTIDSLEKIGYLAPSVRAADGITSVGYKITNKGLEASSYMKAFFLTVYRESVAALARGAVEATYATEQIAH